MEVLKVENLSCGYDEKTVIKDISFSVEEGNFLGIIGPNSTGKTTLFRALTGILKFHKGSVLYKNRPIHKIPPLDFARETAVISQGIEMPFAFSVEEFVLMGRFPHSGRFGILTPRDYEALEKVLNFTDISSLRHRKISELSAGEKQRAVLAQGFIQEPKLLLLDEPTAHLDIAHQVQILDLVKKLNKEKGLTVIIILHDLNLAGSYCDKLILLDEGKIFKKGSPEEVITCRNIEDVYKTVVVVKKNPVSSKPCVFLVSAEDRR